MKQSLNTLKTWFRRGIKPTQSQFSDLFDSFFHKDENVPAASVEGLQELLDEKASAEEVNSGRIASSTIDGNGHLILTLQDGSQLDAGLARGLDGTPGTNGTNAPLTLPIFKRGLNGIAEPEKWVWTGSDLLINEVDLLSNCSAVTMKIGATTYIHTVADPTLLNVTIPAGTEVTIVDLEIYGAGNENANAIIKFLQV